VFAIDFATLAREVAMDIFPLDDILKVHQLSGDDWDELCANPRFKAMLDQMMREWHSAASTPERSRVKAATGVESHIETLIADIGDRGIPLTQRVEAMKFLARVGELDGGKQALGAGGAPFSININIGAQQPIIATVAPRIVDITPVIAEDEYDYEDDQ
jgi:hypothetical protein